MPEDESGAKSGELDAWSKGLTDLGVPRGAGSIPERIHLRGQGVKLAGVVQILMASAGGGR